MEHAGARYHVRLLLLGLVRISAGRSIQKVHDPYAAGAVYPSGDSLRTPGLDHVGLRVPSAVALDRVRTGHLHSGYVHGFLHQIVREETEDAVRGAISAPIRS